MWWCVLGVLPVIQGYITSPPICPDICQCEPFITNCQYNGLNKLPEDIDENIISLDLSYNSFEKLPDLRKYNATLKYLNMSHNRIATLTYSDFEGLKNLELLDFTFNLFHDWKDIHSSTFLPTTKLTYLDLSHNLLRSIPRYSNHLYIESLKILRLTNCSMKSIPVNVFNRLTGLKELHLANNPVVSINSTFQLDNLKFIDLSYCQLHHIDENVFAGLTTLETLILSNNAHLKKSKCNSMSLLYLDLSDCTLETVPTGDLLELSTIKLSGNFLKIIPNNSFLNYPNLQTLNLSTNSISFIEDDAFRGLPVLKNIDLSFNKLTSLSTKLFYYTTSLLKLNLTHNYLRSIDGITSESLKVLDASYCEIYTIDKAGLNNMPNLFSLILSRNFLSSLPDGLYGKNIIYLDVSSCRIKSLTNMTFEEMYSLRQINLAGNLLTTVDPKYFPRVISVNINDNPWRCDCKKLKRMYDWMVMYSEARLDKLICDSPEKFEGKTWRQACMLEWYPSLIHKDTLWWYSIGVVVAMIILLFAVIAIRKVHQMKEKRLNQIEESRRTEEREALRRMQRLQREMHEEANHNAPDPREAQRPPSYNEALLLPRLDASNQSLQSIDSRPSLHGSNPDVTKKGRVRRKRRRRKSEAESRRASRVTVDSDSSTEQEQQMQSTQGRPTLESDF